MAKLKFGLEQSKHRAPAWLQNLTAILIILAAAKHYLIGGIPGIDAAAKDIAYGWFDYMLNGAQVAAAIAMVFIGKEADKPKNPYL